MTASSDDVRMSTGAADSAVTADFWADRAAVWLLAGRERRWVDGGARVNIGFSTGRVRLLGSGSAIVGPRLDRRASTAAVVARRESRSTNVQSPRRWLSSPDQEAASESPP
jgi:hypothetical protein